MGNINRKDSKKNGRKRPSPTPRNTSNNGGKICSQSKPSSNTLQQDTNSKDRTYKQKRDIPQSKPSFWARLFGGKKKSDGSIDDTKLNNCLRKAQEILKKMDSDFEIEVMTAAQLMDLLLSKLDSAYEKSSAQQDSEVTTTCELKASEETESKSEYESLKIRFDQLQQEKDQLNEEKKKQEIQIQEIKLSAIPVEAGDISNPKNSAYISDTENDEDVNDHTLSDLQAELEDVKWQLDQAKESIREYKGQAEMEKALHEDAEERCKAMSAIESKLKDTENDCANFKAEKDKLRDEAEKLKKELESEESDLHKARGERDKAMQEVDRLSQEIEELNAQIEKLKYSDTGRLHTEIKDLQTKNDSLGQSIGDLKKSHEVEIQVKQAEIDKKQGQIDELTTVISEKENIIEEIKATVAGLKGTVAENEKEIKEKESEISDLKKTEKLLKKEAEKLTAERDDLSDRIRQQEASLKEIEDTLASKDADIDSLNSEVDGLKSQIKMLENSVDSKEKEIERGIKEIVSKEEELKASNDEISKSLEAVAKRVNGYAERIMKLLDEGDYEIGFGDMASTCEEDEETNRKYFGRIVEDIAKIELRSMRNTSEYMTAVSKVIETDLELGMEGIILPLARTCAYARLPFMRDDRGTDHMRLDGAKLKRIASGLNALLAQVGIELIVPVPFADKIDEGEYEDGQGNVPNLDYICPNSRSHLDGVDRNDISGVVTDIIKVGYCKGDKIVKAVVLK